MRFYSILSLALALTFSTSALIDPAEANFRKRGSLPACEDNGVVKKITKRFSQTNRQYRDGSLQLASVDGIKETGLREVAAEETDRRFCKASVALSDGNNSTLYYLILEQGGLASIGWGVDYCIKGYDFERAHGSECRSLRAPF